MDNGINFTIDAQASGITIIGYDPGFPLAMLEFEIWSYTWANGIQCSGHSHSLYSGNSFNYDDDTTPCDDKVKGPLNDPTNLKGALTNVNTPGVCRLCDEGWGLYAGYSWQSMQSTGYNYADTGICSERTMHSSSGNACGGYGQPTVSTVRVVNPMNSQQQTSVDRVDACTCEGPNGEDWGLTHYTNKDGIDSGLCQRTCAHGAALIVLPANVSDAFGFNTGRYANQTYYSQTFGHTQCGGYARGLCRPITSATRPDGFNSACMCAIGYGGPNCEKIESMWHAPTGYTAQPCGLHGLGVLRSTAGVSASDLAYHSPGGYADEWWFNSQIVPLNNAQITDPANYALYSAQTCQCQTDKARDGWLPDANGICAPTCGSVELMGLNATSGFNTTLCSAHGSCIDHPLEPGKACRCDPGWGGLNCGTPILRDRQGAVCGGADRGNITYTPGNPLVQYCSCVAPYTESPNNGTYAGLCWKDCPINAASGLVCSGIQQGTCEPDDTASNPNGGNTGNDNVCSCTPGAFFGKDCSQKLVAAYVTASGRSVACSGHGSPDPAGTGFCSCLPGWVGIACQIATTNRDCGFGQCFQDDEALGISVG